MILILKVLSAGFWVLNVTPTKTTNQIFFFFPTWFEVSSPHSSLTQRLCHTWVKGIRRERSLCNRATNTPRNFSNWQLKSISGDPERQWPPGRPRRLWKSTEIAERQHGGSDVVESKLRPQRSETSHPIRLKWENFAVKLGRKTAASRSTNLAESCEMFSYRRRR